MIKRCGNEISSERVLRALAKTHQYFNAWCTFLSRVCNKISFSNCDDQKIRKKIMVDIVNARKVQSQQSEENYFNCEQI